MSARAGERIYAPRVHEAAGELPRSETLCKYPLLPDHRRPPSLPADPLLLPFKPVRMLLLKTVAYKSLQISAICHRKRLTAPHNSVECAFSDSGVVSSAGRASALQAEGRRFDPVTTHHLFSESLLPLDR